MGKTLFWRTLCVILTAIILLLALLPNDSMPQIGFGWDKLNHMAAITAVTGLAFLSLSSWRWAASAAFWYGILLGILIEVCQATLTSNRSAEWADLLADLFGAGAAWIIISIFSLKKEIT